MGIDLSFIFVVCIIGPLFVGGILLIIRGWHTRRQAAARLPRSSRKGDQQWWERLVKWGAITPNSAGWVVLQEFTRSYDLLISSVMIGIGAAALVLLVGGAIALMTTGTLMGLTSLDSHLLTGAFYLGFLLGCGLGLANGFQRLRNVTVGRVTYGDLQPRRLADYRSVVFRWLILALNALLVVMTGILAPHLGSAVSYEIENGTLFQVPTSFWALGAIPAAMFGLLVAGEVVMTRIARLPRLLVTSDPQLAQRADNFLRALTIGIVQFIQLAAIGNLGVAQWSIITQGLWQQGFWRIGSRPYGSLADAALWFASGLAIFCPILPAFFGRLGGRIGGWPWRPMRITP